MARLILAFAIILLELTAIQVGKSSYVPHENVVMIERPLTPTDRCHKITGHPTEFPGCEPSPFPILAVGYETEKTDVSMLSYQIVCETTTSRQLKKIQNQCLWNKDGISPTPSFSCFFLNIRNTDVYFRNVFYLVLVCSL